MSKDEEGGILITIVGYIIVVFCLYGVMSAFFDFAEFIKGGGLCF